MTKYVAESPRLYLQRLNADDHLEDYHRLTVDLHGKTGTLEETKKTLEKQVANAERPWMRSLAILLKRDGQSPDLIGAVGTPRQGEVGYAVRSDCRGKGYASEALKMMSDWYWTDGKKGEEDVLTAQVAPENIASCRVLEKAGFTKGEVKKGAYQAPDQNGVMVDRDAVQWRLERPGAEVPVKS